MILHNEERSLNNIIYLILFASILFVLLHCYWFCFEAFFRWNFYHPMLIDFISRFKQSGLFESPYISKVGCVFLLLVAAFGTQGKKSTEIRWRCIVVQFILGNLLFWPHDYIRSLSWHVSTKALVYISITFSGYLLLMSSLIRASRILKSHPLEDVFNEENECFLQESRLLNTSDSINIPTKFRYQGKEHRGWINIINPYRGTLVMGTPGSGKTFAIVESFIKQTIEKGFAQYVYDFKYPSLTNVVYNHLRLHPQGYGEIKPTFYVINFSDPRKSHRCNPIHPSSMTDISDAYEAAYIIMLNLNRTWIDKQGDFFVESPIVLLAAIIWYLKIYQEGKYCTFPHAIEFLNKDYADIFPILMSYPELENYLSAFMQAWKDKAQDQLQGQIASAKIPLSRMSSAELYWVMSGNDFTLDINNPKAPKIVCIANNPRRSAIYSAALGLYNSRIMQIINEENKQKCAFIVDEFPTFYLRGFDTLIGTGRSNKIAVCAGLQDASQLTKEYGDKESKVIQNTMGNIISGQVLGETAKTLSDRFGKIQQRRESVSINRQDTSTSLSTQSDYLIPSSKIANLSQGRFVGAVSDNYGQEIKQKIFHAKADIDLKQLKKEQKRYVPIPEITCFRDENGKDMYRTVIHNNCYRIKQEVVDIIQAERQRLS